MTHKTLWLLTAAVIIGLLLPALVQQGMFLDGVSYSCIARNMANGLGSFSKPYYTATLYPVCHEQPPLVFWLQSLFFKAFGDHFWVERLYTFCMAMLTVLGIRKVTLLQNVSLFSRPAWLAVLLWVTSPIVFWSFQNNMLECTMALFVMFAVYFAAKSVLEKKNGLLAVAAFFTTAAVLCKGPVGLFPVAVPLAAGLAFRPNGLVGAVGRSALMLVLTISILALFITLVPGMQEYLNNYLQTRLLPTLSGERDEQVGNRLKFLLDLLSQFVIPAILLAVLFARRGFRAFSLPKPALFFFIVGMAGTLPLVFSPKQSAHYLVPAMPFFALGFACLASLFFRQDLQANSPINPENLVNPVKTKTRPVNSRQKAVLEKLAWLILLATLAVSLSCWRKYRRDEPKIRDVKAIIQQVGEGTMLSTPPHLSDDWLLVAYFGRMGNVSLDGRTTHDFWLAEKGGQVPEGYGEVELGLAGYELWRRK